MGVLIVGEPYADSFADNVATSLADAGYNVRTAPPFRGILAGRSRVVTRLRGELPAYARVADALHRHVVETVEEFRPDLVLSLDYRLAWPIVARIRRLAAAMAFWFPDAANNLGREGHVLAGYDAIFVTDTTVARRYRDVLGLNAHFLAEACNPRWHRPIPNISPGDDGPALLIAGNLYATRFVLLRRLADAGIPLRFHGPAWPRWLPADERFGGGNPGPYLERERKARAFRGAFAVLNSMATAESDGANCRLFEAAGCGAVVITEERAQIPTLFDVHHEVRSYSSFPELLDQIKALRRMSPDDRRGLGDAASRRAHHEHTYLNRFQQILDVLGRG
jgi:spore maturation protein CgeB